MSKRNSEYERKHRDNYPTPEGPLDALLSAWYLPPGSRVYEPCPGGGNLVKQLNARGYRVTANKGDFLHVTKMKPTHAIITNPPFGQAELIIRHALIAMYAMHATTKWSPTLALLLSTDYDHAATRAALFDLPFMGQVKLQRRIVWFKRKDGKREQPSENHSWFLWSYAHRGEPWVRYATWEDPVAKRFNGRKYSHTKHPKKEPPRGQSVRSVAPAKQPKRKAAPSGSG